MGELFANQVLHAIARDALNGVDPAKASFVGNKAVGDFLKARDLHARAIARLERADEVRHRRGAQCEGVRGGDWEGVGGPRGSGCVAFGSGHARQGE